MPDEENQTAAVSRICNFLKKSNQNFDVGPLRAFAGLCGPLRAFAGLCSKRRSSVYILQKVAYLYLYTVVTDR